MSNPVQYDEQNETLRLDVRRMIPNRKYKAVEEWVVVREANNHITIRKENEKCLKEKEEPHA